MTKQKLQLVLRSSDISNLGYGGNPFAPVERTADFISEKGFINRYQTKFIWNNVNLRSILGNLYKPSGKYNLKLENITFGLTSNLGGYTALQNDLGFNILISGLPGLEGYSIIDNKTSSAILSSVRVPNGANQTIYNYSNNELTFQLSNSNNIENCSITIEYRDLLTNALEPSNTPNFGYPHIQLIFSIYSID